MVLIQSLFLSVLVWQFSNASPTYTILAPKIIRPRAEYNVIVALDGITKSTVISCTIERSIGNQKEKQTKEFPFDKDNSFQVIKLQLDLDWTEGKYNLTFEGKGDIIFTQIIPIEYVSKQFVILVQSNKAIYKPGQDVLFRAAILDDELKPVDIAEISDLKIFLMDPQDVKLRELVLANGVERQDPNLYNVNKFNYTKGVTQDISFNIPDVAQPGEWKIQVTTRGQIQNYPFFVDYYTLPLANLTIALPEYLKADDPNLYYQINSFYTFGKPVIGKVNVTIEKIKQCGKFIRPNGQWKKTYPISGQFIGQLNLNDLDFFSSNCSDMTFNVSATVIDTKTNSIYYNDNTFNVIKQDIKAVIQDDRKKYRPGKTISKEIKLTSISGKDIKKEKMTDLMCVAEFKTTTMTDFARSPASNIIKEDGKVTCEFHTSSDYTDFKFRIVDKLKNDFLTILETFSSFARNCVNDTVQVTLQDKQSILHSEKSTTLVVESSKPFNSLIFYIVVRGSIVNATQITFDNTLKTQEINLKLTREMVPEALIAVFMKVPMSNVIVSDALLLNVRGVFHNEVSFNVLTPEIDAGEKAKIVVSAESESRIFLLAIDEAVLALKQGNDLNSQRVMKELLFNEGYKEQTDGFLQAGMNVLTNGQSECSGTLYIENFDDEEDDGTKNVQSDKSKIRKNFRETWIWDSTEIPHMRNHTGIMSNVPDSITSWKITGFAIHDQKGLGLTTIPGYVKVFRPFFIKLNLPYSIRRGETSDIHILVFNYLNETIDVDLTATLNSTNSNELIFAGCSKKFNMVANEIKTFTCQVKANRVGRIPIVAEANAVSKSNKKYNDGELREILVIYEGFIKRISKTIYFDLTADENDNEVQEIMKINLPENRIKGSENLLMTATTELITVEWKDKLTDIEKKFSNIHYDFTDPNGCCQQRVTQNYQKVFWLDYLNITKRGTQQDKEMAAKIIQKTIDLLCFKDPKDGSFVYIHDWTIPKGLVSFLWQTAYTLKIMNHASKQANIKLDPNSIKITMDWLKTVQKASGEFIETDLAHTIYTTPTNAYLTAFVRIAMFENGEINPTTDKWLEDNFPSLSNPLDMISTCYALVLIKNKESIPCYDKIISKMVNDSSNGNYWIGSNGKPDLHLTAYGLMILTERKSYALAMKVFKFIVSSQDTQGNFRISDGKEGSDSYITVICTEAMTKFIAITNKYEPGIENVFVKFNIEGNEQTIHLRPKTDIVEVIDGNANASTIKITAKGYGRAKANLYYQYNTLELDDGHFNINLTKRAHNDDYVELDICTNYKKEGHIKNGIVEIDLPSGYKYHGENMVIKNDLIDKIESKNDDTHIIVYLQKIHQDQLCFTIPAVQSHAVQDRHPAQIKVYPYYDKESMSVTVYDV